MLPIGGTAIIASLVALISNQLGLAAATASEANSSRLYFTNGTCIWSLPLSKGGGGGSRPRASALTCEGRRAVGLAADAGIIFWSDVDDTAIGIYRASVADPGNIRKIVSAVKIVNGLATDRIARLLYWTDEGSRLIEAADYDGGARVIIVSHDLGAPRGLLVDETVGYLYWNDQEKGTLERCRLDGSERHILVSRFTLLWPNQMIFADSTPSSARNVLFADGFTGYVHRYDASSGRAERATQSRLSPENVTLFGLAGDNNGGSLYASDWAGNVYELNLTATNASGRGLITLDGAARKILDTGYNIVFSMALSFSNESTSRTLAAACQVDNGGCSHVCLRTGTVTSPARRCACPSYSGLALDAGGTMCREPQQVLVYSAAASGLVAFRDLSGCTQCGDVYVVAQSRRPVAVAYDSLEKMVYWSDVQERYIASARLNGSDRRYLVPPGNIGIVDGMSFDFATGNLYFTNLGEITSAFTNDTYSWHTVEMISTSTLARRVLLSSNLSRPRSLAIDYDARHLYVSDWGLKPRVLQCRMDGSKSVDITLSANWSNPNALLMRDGHLYALDARLSDDTPTLFRISVHAKDWDVETHSLPVGTIPYGLAISDSHVYISDWNSSSVFTFELNKFGSANLTTIIENVAEPMALAYVTNNVPVRQQAGYDNEGCSKQEICVWNEYHRFVGYCPNVGTAAIAKTQSGCTVPESFLIVADLTSVRIRDLESDEEGLLVSGDPFASNFVGVAYDRKTKTVYYSDADEGSIYAIDITENFSAPARRIFSGNTTTVIEGLALDDATSTLYWSASAIGGISSSPSYIAAAKVGGRGKQIASAAAASVEPLITVRGLVEPRGIMPLDGILYWTERGQRPRVQYADVTAAGGSGEVSPKMMSMRRRDSGRTGVRSPNSIAASVNNTYVGDMNEILVCSRQGAVADRDCSSLAVEHVFGLAVSSDGSRLFYTDWNNRAVVVIDGNGSSRPLLRACVRPSMVVVVEASRATGEQHDAITSSGDSLPPWVFGVIAAAVVVLIITVACGYIRHRRNRQMEDGFFEPSGMLGIGGSSGGEENNAYVLTEKSCAKNIGYEDSIPIYEPVECTKS